MHASLPVYACLTYCAAEHHGRDLTPKAVAQNALLPMMGCLDQLSELQVPVIRGVCVMPAACQDDGLQEHQVGVMTGTFNAG